MAARKKAAPKTDNAEQKALEEAKEVIGKKLKPIRKQWVTIRIIGITPVITHPWDEKAKRLIREKQQIGKKTKDRARRDPEAEGKAATYFTEDGRRGIAACALKASLIQAAHVDLGIAKVLVKKSLFYLPYGRNIVLPLERADGKKGEVDWAIEEDPVKIGRGSADLRYRPYYYDWAVVSTWEIDNDLLQVEDLLTLMDRAGFGVGLHEWRPGSNNGGEYGRFKVDPKFKVIVEDK